MKIFKLAKFILKSSYNIKSPQHLRLLSGGFRNNNIFFESRENSYVLTIYKFNDKFIENKIINGYKLQRFLLDLGYPVKTVFDSNIFTSVKYRNLHIYSQLTTFLEGSNIEWCAFTRKHIKQVAILQSKMHESVSGLELGIIENWEDYSKLYFNDDINYLLTNKIYILQKLGIVINEDMIKKIYEKAFCIGVKKAIAIHYDLNRGNVLFKEDLISGVIDFEKTIMASREVDVSRTLAFMLQDISNKTPNHVINYYLRNYNNKSIHMASLNLLVVFHLIRDFKEYLYHNPYEDLASNKHFNSCVKLLQKIRILITAKLLTKEQR